jgi:hypothetical protein
MDDEPKSPAELKEIRLNRKLAQDAEGIRLAKEAADRDKPPEPKAKPKKKKTS